MAKMKVSPVVLCLGIAFGLLTANHAGCDVVKRNTSDVRTAFYGAWKTNDGLIMFFYPDGRYASESKNGDIRTGKRWAIKSFNKSKRTVLLSTDDGMPGEVVEWRLSFSSDYRTATYENIIVRGRSLPPFTRKLTFMPNKKLP